MGDTLNMFEVMGVERRAHKSTPWEIYAFEACPLLAHQTQLVVDKLNGLSLDESVSYKEVPRMHNHVLLAYEKNFPWSRLLEYYFEQYDGKSLINAIKEAGVSLVLHSQEHLDNEVISGRIFEAAAAGAVIISDRHGFVTREFKDAVLYIDIDKDNKLPADEMFSQIYTHLIWVLEHPVEAEKLARKAHSIFSAKFTLEDQLERLGAWHEKLQKELKESR
jgi:glycosyltransferase involved in cell wall biosynthesis